MAAFSTSRDKLGLKTNPEYFKNLSASDLNKLAKNLGGSSLQPMPEGATKGMQGLEPAVRFSILQMIQTLQPVRQFRSTIQ